MLVLMKTSNMKLLLEYFLDLIRDLETSRKKFQKKSLETFLLEEKLSRIKKAQERRKSARLSHQYGKI